MTLPPPLSFGFDPSCFVIRAFCYCMIWQINEWNVWVSVCACFVHEWKCRQKRGKRVFTLPFPTLCLSLCRLHSLSLFLIPSFSCCQSTSCHFVFNLKIISSCFSNFFICRHLCLPYFVSICCLLFCFSVLFLLFDYQTKLQYVILWWLEKNKLEITATLPNF